VCDGAVAALFSRQPLAAFITSGVQYRQTIEEITKDNSCLDINYALH
jgi:hypothetical protein